MEPAVTPLDLDAIRARANAADASWLPRWVPFDIRSLVSEVLHLRGVVKAQVAQAEQRTAQHVEAVIAQQRLTVEAREANRVLAAENAALRAQVAASTEAVTAWLRADAARTPPGLVSPIRRVEQAYAAKVANIIERGGHLEKKP
jgi:hypothetical protein